MCTWVTHSESTVQILSKCLLAQGHGGVLWEGMEKCSRADEGQNRGRWDGPRHGWNRPYHMLPPGLGTLTCR